MNKILVYCLDGIVFVLLIVIFIINQSQISNHDSSKNSLVYINHVVNNWNQKVFEDAKVKPQKGYNRENLDYFEGSEIGCRCLDQVKNEYEYTYGKCETENDTCKTIEEISPRNLSSSTLLLLYVKRGELTYFDYLTNAKKENETCSEGYKQCGILDTSNNKMCLLNNQTCPINFIQFFFYSNDFIENPIFISLNASQKEPCFHPYYSQDDNPFPLRKDYQLHQNCKEIYKGKSIDTRFTLNTNMSSIEYYMDERLTPLYEHEQLNNKNGAMSLYQIHYIGLNLSCYSTKTEEYSEFKKLNIPKILKTYARSIIIYYMLTFLFILLIIINVVYLITLFFSLYSLKARIGNSIWSLNCLLGFISSFLIMSFFFQIKLNLKFDYGCMNEEFENYLFKEAEELLRTWKLKDEIVLIISLLIGLISFIRDYLKKDENLDINYLDFIAKKEEEDIDIRDSTFYKEELSVDGEIMNAELYKEESSVEGVDK